MPVLPATWADLGYRKLGPSSWFDAKKTALVARIITERGCHEVLPSIHEYWLRDRFRRTDVPFRPMHEKVGSVGADSIADPSRFHFLAAALDSPYGSDAFSGPTLPIEQLAAFAKPEDGEAPWRAIHRLGLAIAFSPLPALATVLREHVLPRFLELYPSGRIVAYQADHEYERRHGMLRGFYSLAHYEHTDLSKDSGLGTLRDWQSLGPTQTAPVVGSLVDALFYPQVHLAQAGVRHLRFYFLLDPPAAHSLPPFPRDWLATAQSNWAFGHGARDDLTALTASPSLRTQAAHRRVLHQHKYSANEIEVLLDWLMARMSDFAFHSTDPCEFIADGCIDPVTCFGFALTADRVFRRAVACVASDTAFDRKSAAMEVADLMEELQTQWKPGIGSTEHFKRLHHPVDGRALLLGALSRLPAPFAAHLTSVAETIYDELLSTLRSSVWVKTKLTAAGVLVKDRELKSEREEASADFAANLLRALRNAHHGYMTHRDRQQRPSRYLALSTGDVPDSLACLGLLWAVALLSAPEDMIGWRWMPVGCSP